MATTMQEIMELEKIYVGRVIGQNGRVISKIQKDTSCKMQIDQTQTPCKVTLKGTKQAVDAAREAVEALVRESAAYDEKFGSKDKIASSQSVSSPGTTTSTASDSSTEKTEALKPQVGTATTATPLTTPGVARKKQKKKENEKKGTAAKSPVSAGPPRNYMAALAGDSSGGKKPAKGRRSPPNNAGAEEDSSTQYPATQIIQKAIWESIGEDSNQAVPEERLDDNAKVAHMVTVSELEGNDTGETKGSEVWGDPEEKGSRDDTSEGGDGAGSEEVVAGKGEVHEEEEEDELPITFGNPEAEKEGDDDGNKDSNVGDESSRAKNGPTSSEAYSSGAPSSQAARGEMKQEQNSGDNDERGSNGDDENGRNFNGSSDSQHPPSWTPSQQPTQPSYVHGGRMNMHPRDQRLRRQQHQQHHHQQQQMAMYPQQHQMPMYQPQQYMGMHPPGVVYSSSGNYSPMMMTGHAGGNGPNSAYYGVHQHQTPPPQGVPPPPTNPPPTKKEKKQEQQIKELKNKVKELKELQNAKTADRNKKEATAEGLEKKQAATQRAREAVGGDKEAPEQSQSTVVERDDVILRQEREIEEKEKLLDEMRQKVAGAESTANEAQAKAARECKAVADLEGRLRLALADLALEREHNEQLRAYVEQGTQLVSKIYGSSGGNAAVTLNKKGAKGASK